MRQTFFERFGLLILCVVAFSLAFIWMGTKRTILSNQNDVADWLPDSYKETKDYKWFLSHFPFEKFVIVSWEGCTMDDDRVEMLAQKLVPWQTMENLSDDVPLLPLTIEEPNPSPNSSPLSPPPSLPSPSPSSPQGSRQYFKSVLTGPRLLQLLEEQYTDLPERTVLQRLDGLLIGPDKTADGQEIPLENRGTALLVTLIPDVSGKELRTVLAQVHKLAQECGVELPPPVDTRSVLIKLRDFVVEFVRELIYGRHPTTEGAILGGPPVDNVSLDYEGERTLYRLAGLCALFGAGLSLLCFRDIRLTAFVFWVAILAAGIAMAAVWVTGGRCDSILLSMPALIYVLAMSGAIHIVNYYHDAIREHGLSGAAERAVAHAWFPCSMAALTTAIGLGSLYTSHLVPITKFGIYSAIGVLLSLFLLFLWLPALLHAMPSFRYAKLHAHTGIEDDHSLIARFWTFFGNIVIKYNKTVVLLCLGLLVYFGYGLTQTEPSIRMMRFFSPDAEIIKHYTWLEDQLGPLVPMEIVLSFDNTKCQMTADGQPLKISSFDRIRFVDTVGKSLKTGLGDEVGGLLSAVTFGPKLQYNPSGFSSRIRRQSMESIISGAIDKNRESLHEFLSYDGNPSFTVNPQRQQELQNSLKLREQEATPEVMRFYGVNCTPEDLTATLAAMELTAEDAAILTAAGILDLQDLLTAISQEASSETTGTTDTTDTPKNSKIVSLPAAELAKYQDKGKEWQKKVGHDLWRISLRVWSLKREIDYADFVTDVKRVVQEQIETFEAQNLLQNGALSAVYTGMVPVVYKTQKELLIGLIKSLVLSFVLIAIVMSFILRSPIAGLLAMLPNMFPVVVIFGFMGIQGILVDVGTMMTASVALGIAVDDTVHFLTWFREGIDAGLDAKGAAQLAYKRCATAMTQTTLVGGLGLSAFAFSTFTPTQMFGIMMLAILTVALIGDLIFLPAILTGPAGKFFVPKRRGG